VESVSMNYILVRRRCEVSLCSIWFKGCYW